MSIAPARRPHLAAFFTAWSTVFALVGLASDARAQALPAGWAMADVGRPAAPGSATFSSGGFLVSSRGYDVTGTADQFTFVYHSIKGDATIVAKVGSLLKVDPAAKAGLMVRESLDAGSINGYAFVTAANGLGARTRKSSKGNTTSVANGSATVPVWLKLERRASTLTASRSVDGVTWTVIASVKQQMSQTLLVGLAVVSHTAGASVSASLENVSVNGSAVGVTANTPPAVSLTSPTPGASFAAPAAIALAASASDSNGSVSKVDFYAGSTFLGSDTTSPYAFTWNSVQAGTYALKAIATDNAGAATTSATVNVTVGAANVAPAVSLTSPSSGASFTAPAAVAFTAAASDSDGTIQRVDFYVGSTLIGSDTTSPYSFTWLNVALGSYSVSAVARDNRGATTVSAWRDFTVAVSNVPSTAVFTPAVVPDPIDYYVLEVFAPGSDPNTAAPIASQNLGLPAMVDGECIADVRSLMLSLAPGSYMATVSSVSALEGVLRSPSFAFTR